MFIFILDAVEMRVALKTAFYDSIHDLLIIYELLVTSVIHNDGVAL